MDEHLQNAALDPAERRTVPDGALSTAFVTGVTFAARPMTYQALDGLAIVQGDIVIGTVEEVEAEAAFQRMNAARGRPLANDVIPEPERRWPDGVVPYVIDAALPDPERVEEGIAHWRSRTGMRFVARTTESDYVRFVPHPTRCASPVGRQGGAQLIRLTSKCGRGQVIHEIFHTVGAWHEHTREDRDLYVRVDLDAVEPDQRSNFEIAGDNIDIGEYDYGSVMHYSADAFGIDGRQTIYPLRQGVQIGQRDGLSDRDVDAVEWMYPGHGHLPAPIPTKDPAADPPDKDPAADPPDKFAQDDVPKNAKDDDPSIDIPKEAKEDTPSIDIVTLAKSYGGEYGEEFGGDLGDDMGDAISQAGGRVPFVLSTGSAIGGRRAPGVVRGQLRGIRNPQHEALARMHQSLVAFTRLYGAGLLTPADARAWAALAAAYEEYVRSIVPNRRGRA